MACANCGDSIWDLLKKILDRLNEMTGGGGGGGGTSNAVMGEQSIGIGVDFVDVVFAVPFASAPHVVASISRPAGQFLIEMNVNQDSITAAGFRAELSATTPTTDFVIHYVASIA